MKKIFYILAGAALILTSCDKTLDKYPLDKLTEKDFFQTESGLLAFSNAFYGCFPGGSSLYLDNADNYFQKEQLLEARGGRQVPASGGGWTWTYLRNFNTLLDNVNQCQDEKVRAKYTAIARFFRAYFYFEKVKRFGDVPWISTQLGSADQQLYAPRDNRDTVMQNIIADLNYAIANLPQEKSVYTVTKWTAMALMSRACLFEGTYRKYHNITGLKHDANWYLNKTVEVSRDFIMNSGYGIYDNGDPNTSYLTLFSQSKVSGSPVAKEVILARNYNSAYSMTHSSNYQFLTASMGIYGMSRKTVLSYLMKDGTPYTQYYTDWQTKQFKDEVANRDPRLGQTIRIPGYKRIDGTTTEAPDLSCTITGYQPIKYVTAKMVDGTDKDSYNASDNDLILFRAGEVYLNFAEALAELGQPVAQSDLDLSINKLRARVGMPKLMTNVAEDPFLTNKEWGGYQNVKNESNKALILEIRRERCVELNQEGFRYYDLMRWKEGKIFEEQMWGMYFPGPGAYDLDGDGKDDVELYEVTPTSSATVKLQIDKDVTLSDGKKGMINPFKNLPGKWDETNGKDYLYPIPTDEITLNTNLVQNPGW